MVKRIGETSYKETAFGILPRAQLIPLEIEGIKRAWDFVLNEHKTKGNLSLTSYFLQRVHRVGFGWIFPEMGGKFRVIEVRVSAHELPKAYQVSQMMKDFTEDLEIRIKHLPQLKGEGFFDQLIDLLAWLHHRFLWIHPFVDYNGRIGRLLINMVLLNLNLPPIEMRVATKAGRVKYIKALASADQGDYSLLKTLIRSALEEAAKEF